MNGFHWMGSELYAVPSRVTHIDGTAAEVYTKGEALSLSATGAWTKAANGAAIGGFANESKTCTASDLKLEVIEARPGDRFRAPYTGAPAAGFVRGVTVADVAADGLSVLSSDVIGGALAVWDIITAKTECIVTVKNRIFS